MEPSFSFRSGINRKGNMGGLGVQEMIVILIVALIIFGPKKLPELGKSLGKGIAEFKKASSDLAKTWEEDVAAEKKQDPPPVEKEVVAEKKQDPPLVEKKDA
jgi:sec-independent protein translocase protein TatA